jgi:hypothetical protein
MTGKGRKGTMEGAVSAGVLLLAALVAVPALKAQTYSHARIVRLSFVEGTVSVQRPGVAEWAEAPVNTPIQEGFKVATAANSFAEIEFENSSTARLGEQSELDFTQLALAPDGGKINRMTMAAGYATFDVIPEAGDVYTVTAGQTVLSPAGRTIFRVDLNSTAQRVEVFRGIVNVSSPYGSGQLTQNDVLEITPAERAYVVTHGITEDAWDHWVKQRDQVLLSEKARAVPAGVGSGYSSYAGLYGWNDLSYYGNWSDIPGYGYGWSPFMSAGWMPFSDGQWVWYPGFGWTWISYEPWGWLPFHYGNWAMISGFGWTWFPGEFGDWSPACVTWYQGNGWVGWSPSAPAAIGGVGGVRTIGGVGGIRPNRNVILAVGTDAFRTGRPINPNDLLRETPQLGQRIVTPNIAPTASAFLPGRVTTAPVLRTAVTTTETPNAGVRFFTGSPTVASTRVASGAHTLVIGSRSAPRTGVPAPTVVLPPATAFAGTKASGRTPAGIVFDSKTGQFVNNPNAAPPMVRSRESITTEPGGQPMSQPPKTRTLLAPAAGMTAGRTLPAQPRVQAPATAAPKSQSWFSRIFGGRSSPKSLGQTGMGTRPSERGRQMTLGGPASAPRGGQSAPRQQSRPSFGRSASPRSSGGDGIHMSSGGGGFGGGGVHMGGGGGEVHSAPSTSNGRPHY